MLLALVFILFGCRQENLLVEKEQQSKNLKISVLDYDQVQSQKSLINKISDLESKVFKKGMSAKSVQDSLLDGAIIETNKALLVEDGDKKTYTFPVSRIYPNNKIENLVLRKNEDNSYSGALFQYSLTDAEKQQYIKGLPVDLSGKIKAYIINDISIGNKSNQFSYFEGCWEFIYETNPCSAGGNHAVGESCSALGPNGNPAQQAQPASLVAAISHCGEESGGGGSSSGSTGPGPGSSPGTGTIGGGSGGGGGGSSQPIGPYNTFMFISYDDLYILCAEGDTQCAENWANMSATVNVFTALGRNGLVLPSYTETFLLVKDYLVANSFSPDATAFISERLNIVGNWIKVQDNSTDEKRLKNHQFALWALKYFMNNSSQNFVDYYKNNLLKFNALKFSNFNPSNPIEAEAANLMANLITEYFVAEQNGTVSQLQNNWVGWDLVKEAMELYIKGNIVAAVKLGRWIYEFADDYFPAINIPLINFKLAEMRTAILLTDAVNMNPQTMKWKDIVACWLLEVGDFPVNSSAGYGNIPTIGFSGSDYVISGVPNQLNQMRYLVAHKTLADGSLSPGSIARLRSDAINQIKFQNSLSPLGGEWSFNFDAMVDTIKELDGLQYCLGSYQTTINITSLGNNQYKLTFIVKNKTGWQSGTRGLNDYDGNPANDSIIPDKPRGQGIHLGGTIGETYGWHEIVTIP